MISYNVRSNGSWKYYIQAETITFESTCISYRMTASQPRITAGLLHGNQGLGSSFYCIVIWFDLLFKLLGHAISLSRSSLQEWQHTTIHTINALRLYFFALSGGRGENQCSTKEWTRYWHGTVVSGWGRRLQTRKLVESMLGTNNN